MKKLIFASIIFAIILLIAYQGEAKIDPETALGIWLLDEGDGDIAADSSGNGHDGEIVEPADWVEGQFGNALEFSGSGQVKIQPTPELDLITFTMVLWYKGEPTGDKWQGLVGKPNTGTRNYGCLYRNASGAARAEFNTGGDWISVNSKTDISDDKWHHIAGTYDGETIKVWVDGVAEDERAESREPDLQPDQPFYIGTTGGHKCNGIIDDVGLFKVALEEEDIQEIMTEGLSDSVSAAVSSRNKLATIWGNIKSE